MSCTDRYLFFFCVIFLDDENASDYFSSLCYLLYLTIRCLTSSPSISSNLLAQFTCRDMYWTKRVQFNWYLSVSYMYDLSADLGNVVIQPRMECNCVCVLQAKRGEICQDKQFAHEEATSIVVTSIRICIRYHHLEAPAWIQSYKLGITSSLG